MLCLNAQAVWLAMFLWKRQRDPVAGENEVSAPSASEPLLGENGTEDDESAVGPALRPA